MAARGESPGPMVLALNGAIGRADVPALCTRVCVLLEGGDGDRIVCDVGGLVDPDVETVDVLARLQLTAQRLGAQVRLRRVSIDLQELIVVAGLCDVLPLSRWSAPPGQ